MDDLRTPSCFILARCATLKQRLSPEAKVFSFSPHQLQFCLAKIHSSFQEYRVELEGTCTYFHLFGVTSCEQMVVLGEWTDASLMVEGNL